MKPKIQGHFAKKQQSKATPAFAEWKKAPTEDNYHKVYAEVEPAVQSALKTFAGGDTSLRTRARILATEAMNSYDPHAGAALSTHVFNHLKRLQRVRAERGVAVHIPENVRADRAMVDRYVREHEDLKGEVPSDERIGDALGLSLKRVRRTRTGELPVSTMTGEKGDLPAQPRDASQIWLDYVYHDLDDKDKKILEWTAGYNDVEILPKRVIAKKLGISPAAVSQRISKILVKIEEGAS